MANKRLQTSLKRYLSKMKNSKPQLHLSLNNSMMMSKSFILSGCKHTKTQSFAVDETQGGDGGGSFRNNSPRDEDVAAQLEDIDKFLFENFRSLYLHDVDVDNNNRSKHSNISDDDDDRKEARKKGKERMILFDSPSSVDCIDVRESSTPFYLRRESSSTSLVEEGFRSSLTVSEETTAATSDHDTRIDNPNRKERSSQNNLLEGSIAVLTYSSSPYDEFKKSMQELVDTQKSRHDGRVDWEFMEQIFFCFIKLNDKKFYKYIMNAFVDLIITFRGETTPSRGQTQGTTVMSVRRKKRMDHLVQQSCCSVEKRIQETGTL